MADTATFASLSEDGAIDRSDRTAMLAWSRIRGVCQEQILIAVAVVGQAYDRVRDYLKAGK
ncbi:hypothetical protein [Sphingopyxis sp.]|uniref:hypothetical protein n=1 Tax=Sphingopyxis sp. TaxID=1908224 RepID=UPI001D9C1EA7|nr:hypothetical protein [Sphingopyxis sp.]MBW8294734.1 hypothetical protein [Sphingopyxis sp.]